MEGRGKWKREIKSTFRKVIVAPRKQIYEYSQVHNPLDPGRKWNVDKTFGRQTSSVYVLFQEKTAFIESLLRILTGKNYPKIKLQCLRKIQIWTFGSLVHEINSFPEVLKLKQIFQKNKTVTSKTPLFVIGKFCSRHSICLYIGF